MNKNENTSFFFLYFTQYYCRFFLLFHKMLRGWLNPNATCKLPGPIVIYIKKKKNYYVLCSVSVRWDQIINGLFFLRKIFFSLIYFANALKCETYANLTKPYSQCELIYCISMTLLFGCHCISFFFLYLSSLFSHFFSVIYANENWI